jgi:hypothetical protein
MLSRKARCISQRLKEILMNTDKVIEFEKVIELGKVSEETKGGVGQLESIQEPHRGPGG